MQTRLNIEHASPVAYKAMYALSAATAKTNLTPIQKELIKIRASQINGCAFCLDMHTKDALKVGETAQRIFLLNAWREAGLFSEEEQMILTVTEEVTLIHNGGLAATTYAKAVELFGEETVAQIIMCIVTINAWNRIAISTLLPIPA